jgi:hypothetical protein
LYLRARTYDSTKVIDTFAQLLTSSFGIKQPEENSEAEISVWVQTFMAGMIKSNQIFLER